MQINKKIMTIVLLIIGFMFCSTSCNTSTGQLEVPTDFKITNSIISYKASSSAKQYRIEIRNVETNTIMRRYVEDGIDLNTLNIPEGEYMIKIQACSSDENNNSAFSEEIAYSQVDLFAVKEIKESALIDGRFIKWLGRTSYNEETKTNTMYYSASGFSIRFKGSNVTATINATNATNASKRPYLVVVLDNDFENAIDIEVKSPINEFTLIGSDGFIINDDEIHEISLYKRTESIDSHISLSKITTDGKFIEGVTYKTRKIEVIAASSSTGYGNLGSSSETKTSSNSDALKGFAFLSAQALNAELNIVSASGWGIYASRWTTPNTINMKDRYKYVDVFSDEIWDTSKYIPDVIVTNFGTNDLSYINLGSDANEKLKRTDEFITSYVEFLKNLHATYPNAQIIIIYGLMLESGIYDETETIYERALEVIPSLALLKVQGDAAGCNSHPSVSSHLTISIELTNKIKQLMAW